MENNASVFYPGSGFTLTNFESVLVDAGNRFIDLAKKTITDKNKIDTGALSDLQITSVTSEGNKYTLTIGYPDNSKAWEYYDFQNKGVKGFKSGRPNSIYAYKSLDVSPEMVKDIMQWYLRHQNYIKKETQKKDLSGLQRRRKSIAKIASKTKDLEKLAYNTAVSIKKKGRPRVGFIDDNIELAFDDEFRTKLGEALGEDILIKFKQDFNGNRN
jgi:hypothetical protein